jgi:hypothetical protein
LPVKPVAYLLNNASKSSLWPTQWVIWQAFKLITPPPNIKARTVPRYKSSQRCDSTRTYHQNLLNKTLKRTPET